MAQYDTEAGDRFIVIDRMTGQPIPDVITVDSQTGQYEVWARDAQGNYVYQDYAHKRSKRKGRILVLKDER